MCKCDVNNHWPVEVPCFVVTRHSLHGFGDSKHDRYFELYIWFQAVFWCITSVLRTNVRDLVWKLYSLAAQKWETTASQFERPAAGLMGRTDVQTQMCWLGFYLKEQSLILIPKDSIYPINRADRSIKLKSAQLADGRCQKIENCSKIRRIED